MRKLIAVVGIIGLSFALAAPPAYAACTSGQQPACNDANTERTNDCNFAGAPQSCYTASVCQYYACMEACGDGMVPMECGAS